MSSWGEVVFLKPSRKAYLRSFFALSEDWLWNSIAPTIDPGLTLPSTLQRSRRRLSCCLFSKTRWFGSVAIWFECEMCLRKPFGKAKKMFQNVSQTALQSFFFAGTDCQVDLAKLRTCADATEL